MEGVIVEVVGVVEVNDVTTEVMEEVVAGSEVDVGIGIGVVTTV